MPLLVKIVKRVIHIVDRKLNSTGGGQVAYPHMQKQSVTETGQN